jgi:NAD(P)-dependent dehydrogenase (short-subunit alcohol dehydrogenase family)
MIPKGFSLDDKLAVVTGAGRGWFEDIAIALADAGADVVVAAKDSEMMAKLADGVRHVRRRALAVPTDVADPGQVQAMVDQAIGVFGKVDILVNAADVQFAKPLTEVSWDEWQQVLNINLASAFLCCKAVIPRMVAQRAGRIINVSSGPAARGVANLATYSASKGGLVAFTRALAVELGRNNIRVCAVAPGWFEEDSGNGEEDRLAPWIPLRRRTRGQDIGALVTFLASDAASYVTGHVFFVDGGAQIHP